MEDSWPSPPGVPEPLRQFAAAGTATVDVLLALISIAIWTRPPVCFGFSLSDYWACLRYLPAIGHASRLHLREEWSAQDPHQKTLLSDDFGVGFSTWLLGRTLDFQWFGDTLYVARILAPGQFELGRTSRLGPRKSPDFVVIDGADEISVVECKGGQTSISALEAALQRGFRQKRNLSRTDGGPFLHSLVSGIYIPQWESEEPATFMVRDPPAKDILKFVAGFSPRQIRASVVRVAAAKEVALFGLENTANVLAGGSKDSDLPGAINADLESLQSGTAAVASVPGVLTEVAVNDDVRFRRESRWVAPAYIDDGDAVEGVGFEGALPRHVLELLKSSATPSEFAESALGLSSRLNERSDQIGKADSSTFLTPLGATYAMTLLRR